MFSRRSSVLCMLGFTISKKTYFGGVAELETASEAFFDQCTKGSDPLFDDGWIGWPETTNQNDVLNWFAGFSDSLATFAQPYKPTPLHQRRLLARPNQPIDGSVAKRKLDIGFVSDSTASRDSKCHWSQILVPGELKSNPSADKASEAWLDLGRYAREVFAAQDTRRFVLGFTLCGSFMRIWAFDRLGGIASGHFDINKDGLRFVSAILGFLWMDDTQLGYDPTIIMAGAQRYIEINRDGEQERLILDKCMKRAPCVTGRATTCWKAHRNEDPGASLVIKDSWQYTERGEEGELLREATSLGINNVARYYHHETVQIGGIDDGIQGNVRKGLDVSTSDTHRAGRPALSWGLDESIRQGRSAAGVKRSSSQTGASLPPNKTSFSDSPTKAGGVLLPNRVHRRIVLRDFGEPIYKSSSQVHLLRALEGCIEGHEFLYKAGLLHRDISINNVMINEVGDNSSWAAFLIDLDLAIRVERDGVTGAKGKTGTKAFMAIGALLGEQHSFMHDLESFFWVLFWICIHYEGPGEGRVVPVFDEWNRADPEELAKLKLGTISDEDLFRRTMTESFTTYHEPLIPWVSKLRKVVFPGGGRWKQEDLGLYLSMKEALIEAANNLSNT